MNIFEFMSGSPWLSFFYCLDYLSFFIRGILYFAQ